MSRLSQFERGIVERNSFSVSLADDFVGPMKPLGLQTDKIAATAESLNKELAPLSFGQRKRVLRHITRDAKASIAGLEQSLKEKEKERERVKLALAAWGDAANWCGLEVPMVLEKNDCSRLHKLKDAGISGRMKGSDGEDIEKSDSLIGVEHTFVVRHDWAGAFEKATGLEDCFKLPYQACAFEFRIIGRTIIAIAVQADDEHFTDDIRPGEIKFHAFLEGINDHWIPLAGNNSEDQLIKFLWAQIRAICIALDAEVATHEIVRASVELNEKRAKKGKLPLLDYRIVDLAKRHRVSNPLNGVGEGKKKRMHFRRGHWRHFVTGIRTWVRWCLVGDPDLGFIHKHYQL